MSILFSSLFGLMAISGTAEAKKDKPIADHTKSVTISPLKALWPALAAEYEMEIQENKGLAIGFAVGQYNNIFQRLAQGLAETAGGSATYQRQSLNASYSWYFNDFNRGFYGGFSSKFDRNVYILDIEGVEDPSDDPWSTLTLGPHLGVKIASQGGFTFSWDIGFGYRATFGVDAESGEGGALPLAGLGSLNMGWSF
ncbi:MAG: hypothetical protein VXZ96_17685 [Myxococcota bacterium]|nr:hypothetical protein [Myxococcota bacterium]